MNIKHLKLEAPLFAICREYPGAMTDTRQYLDDVQQFLDKQGIEVRPNYAVSVFFDSEDRSWQGGFTENLDQNLPPNLFEIEMPEATYLAVTFEQNPIDNIPKAMETLDKTAAREGIRRGPRTYIVTRPNGEGVVFDVMQRILLL